MRLCISFSFILSFACTQQRKRWVHVPRVGRRQVLSESRKIPSSHTFSSPFSLFFLNTHHTPPRIIITVIIIITTIIIITIITIIIIILLLLIINFRSLPTTAHTPSRTQSHTSADWSTWASTQNTVLLLKTRSRAQRQQWRRAFPPSACSPRSTRTSELRARVCVCVCVCVYVLQRAPGKEKWQGERNAVLKTEKITLDKRKPSGPKHNAEE